MHIFRGGSIRFGSPQGYRSRGSPPFPQGTILLLSVPVLRVGSTGSYLSFSPSARHVTTWSGTRQGKPTSSRGTPVGAETLNREGLVDIVSVVSRSTLPADGQHSALYSEAEHRGLPLPQRFSVPDRSLWEPGYAAEAAQGSGTVS